MGWSIGIVAVLTLIALGVPIGFAMAAVGMIGTAVIIGVDPMLAMVGQVFFDSGMSYTLSVVPLFVLMGNFVVQAGLADELYASSNAWLRHRPGGLAMATILACGGFASVCGSSLATVATMARVAAQPMRRHGYSDRLVAGTIAAGGTLGILVPPSVMLVLYGIIAGQDIGELFLAGILPGVVGVFGYMLAVRLTLRLTGERSDSLPRLPLLERLLALKGAIGTLALFVLVMGGIYSGVFTVTEAAGVGAGSAFLLALVHRRLGPVKLWTILVDTARMTCVLFVILFGALLFSNFVNLAGLPQDLRQTILAAGAQPQLVLVLIFFMYLVLGAVLESMSMLLLTVPVFYPLVQELGVDLIWFGIFVVMAIEISLITPPIGLNVFVLKTVMRDVDTRTVFLGVIPFLVVDLIRILLLLAIPALALAIPSTM